MKLVLVVLMVVASLLAGAEARAESACGKNFGIAPKRGGVLPQRAQLVLYDTSENKERFEVRIAGKKVPLKVESIKAGPFYLTTLHIGSDAVGKLELYREWGAPTNPKTEEGLLLYARYTVQKDLKLAEKTTATVRSFFREIRHSTVKETYDALILELSDPHAVKATVKLRRDDKVTWQTWEMPVMGGDSLGDLPSVRIGELGCQSNYSAALLRAGVDIEATLTMADGSTRQLELPARLKLAAPPPPPPAPPPVPARP